MKVFVLLVVEFASSGCMPTSRRQISFLFLCFDNLDDEDNRKLRSKSRCARMVKKLL